MDAQRQQTQLTVPIQQSGQSAIDNDLFDLVPTRHLCLPIGNKNPVKTRNSESNLQPAVVGDFE